MTVTSQHGVVAAGHAATAQAAADVLRAGGNAVDAVIAGVFASFVAEPILTGFLGGALLAAQLPDGSAHLLDGFARMPGLDGPRIGTDLDFTRVSIDFGPARQEFHIGRGAAAVPGTHRVLFEAHRRWGSLPLEALVEPACELAREGVALTPLMAALLLLLAPILVHTADSRRLFAPGGALLQAGERHRNPDLANLLDRLAREGLDGPTGQALDAAILDQFGPGAGLLTARDLARSRPVLRHPLAVRYRTADVFVPPPPALGGPLVALGLRLLEQAQPPPGDSVQRLAWMAEVQRCLTEARREEPSAFLADTAVQALYAAVSAAALGITASGSTTHIGVIDRHGMAAGMTHSNGEGCGHVVAGTGVMMNNFLGEEDINPAGFHRYPAGQEIPTMMCPTLVRRGETRWVLGSGGSNRIRTAILQVLWHLLEGGLAPEAAVRAPRMHVEGNVISFETAGRPADELATLAALGAQPVPFEQPSFFFGGVHLAGAGPDGFTGAGDPRRGGVLVAA